MKTKITILIAFMVVSLYGFGQWNSTNGLLNIGANGNQFGTNDAYPTCWCEFSEA